MIDVDEARGFLAALDPDPGSFTFQTFDDNRDLRRPALARVLCGTLDEHLDEMNLLQGAGAGVFVTVNYIPPGPRTQERVSRVRAVFVDLDGAPVEPCLNWTHKPDIVVESSPSRYHAYWLVKDPTGFLDEFTAIQKKLAVLFNGDPSVCNADRVLRLPGTWHKKVHHGIASPHTMARRIG